MTEDQSVVPSSQSAEVAVIASISLSNFALFSFSVTLDMGNFEQIVCLFSGSYLGVAIYDQSRTAIRLLNDVLEDQEFSTLKSLLQQEEPTTILVNKSQDIRFIRYISQLCGATISSDDINVENSTDAVGSSFTSSPNSFPPSAEVSTSLDERPAAAPAGSPNKNTGADDGDGVSDDEEDPESSPPTLIFLANNAYNFETGFKRISELFAEECSNEAENHLSARFRIDFSSRNMVRALGALLKYMDSARTGVEYEAANVCTPITAIKTIRLGEMVEIDKGTYRALDIFSEDKAKQRPSSNAYKSSGYKSLFILCNRCRSTPGKYLLRKWFEHPTADREVLTKRQKAISFFLQDCNLELTGKLHTLLGSLRSVRHILNRLRAGTAKVAHWENLYKTISSSVMIGRYLESLGSPLALLQDDMDCYSETLVETYAVLNAMIDFEESYAENRLVMRPDVDPELDRAKRLYRRLPSILTQVAQDESSRFKAATCSVAYVPMIGYLVALPHDFQVEDFEDVEVIYSTTHTLHAKDERMRTLDEELGDVKMRIIDKETTITLRRVGLPSSMMSSLILSRSSLLLSAERAGALLDAVISLALTARHFGWTCPKFVDEPIIDATRVYHPLSQLITEHFVPNPVSSGVEYSKIKIFTGPNACGKSVYLKQVGLLVFLAHIGSFVPADFARIGTVNRILSRMYTVDSVLDGMSTFAKDLDQISLALRRGNERSLVIIDEFGKGTMTEVGLSLLASSLSYWAAKGRDGCPHIFVSSHFHALHDLITDAHGIISYHTMEVLKKGAELNFQFRLVDGLVDSSFAVYTACKMGVPQDVVDRANEVYEHVRGGHALSELSCVDSNEERKNTWLARRMQELL
ncbi:MutS domain V protein [Ancylostoma caninum]|uniref:MutS domain V protein n=1 Tax=Ancylostoma caninum TaxID=29170 RepID=A0A368H5N1_ANCCA|nr:MutS domain V protein [Ancylostoma caninum]